MSDSSSDKHLGFTPELYPAGTHACYMYCDETERRSVVHPFVLAGLQDDETVHYLAGAIPASAQTAGQAWLRYQGYPGRTLIPLKVRALGAGALYA